MRGVAARRPREGPGAVGYAPSTAVRGDAAATRRVGLDRRAVDEHAQRDLGSGRTVALEREAPNVLVHMV